jgi:hypothetical protein
MQDPAQSDRALRSQLSDANQRVSQVVLSLSEQADTTVVQPEGLAAGDVSPAIAQPPSRRSLVRLISICGASRTRVTLTE